MNARIIGCGNRDRGDDAAGLLAAHRLRELGLEAEECSGECLCLLDLWHGARHAILVDAVAGGGRPGSIRVWDAVHERLARDAFRCSSHHFGVAEAVELGRILGRLPARLTIYGVTGERFDVGAPVSPAVAEAVERLALQLAEGRRERG